MHENKKRNLCITFCKYCPEFWTESSLLLLISLFHEFFKSTFSLIFSSLDFGRRVLWPSLLSWGNLSWLIHNYLDPYPDLLVLIVTSWRICSLTFLGCEIYHFLIYTAVSCSDSSRSPARWHIYYDLVSIYLLLCTEPKQIY